MYDEQQYDLLTKGVAEWNYWRMRNSDVKPFLLGADLSNAKLSGANLIGANLQRANLSNADLRKAILYTADLYFANLAGANLSGAELMDANLMCANLRAAYLRDANLRRARFSFADLGNANLRRAALIGADFVQTNLTSANLTDCSIYGVSVWGARLHRTIQSNLVVTPPPHEGPAYTVDDIEVAQFINLLLNNTKIRRIIDTITTKVVLILGRFSSERKAILNAIKEKLRYCNYIPILFDFEPPQNRDTTETVVTLAQLARFIIADITDARSIPQELYATIPHLRSVPVQPLLQSSEPEYGMFSDLKKYPWVLEVHLYTDLTDLLSSFDEKVIAPAEAKAKESVKQRLD